MTRDQLEEKIMEIRHLREENKRLLERSREQDLDLDKCKKDQGYVMQRQE